MKLTIESYECPICEEFTTKIKRSIYVGCRKIRVNKTLFYCEKCNVIYTEKYLRRKTKKRFEINV